MDAIVVSDLRKTFVVHESRPGFRGAIRDLWSRKSKTVEAVRGVSFSIPKGEICGYIGENGAGKSTTIKMLCGIMVPTSGTVLVDGVVPYVQRESFVRRIGCVFGQRSQLWWDLGVIESFSLLQKVYRVPVADYRARLDELTERLVLQSLLHLPVRKLSLGQRMRCELAAAMLHNPSLLFLDEPTIGLDVLVKGEIRSFLKSLNARYGTTILLTTHDLQDIEALCSRVMMLDAGQVLYDGALEALKAAHPGKELRLRLSTPCTREALDAVLAKQPYTIEDEGMTVRIRMASGTHTAAVIAQLSTVVDMRDMQLIETSTEDIVRTMYTGGAVQ
jgi:ABC-2 type transport system ATP-binding protein